MALLEVRNLQVNYGPIQAVKGIDLDVEKGTIVALLGANGAGKTTTLRAITGMVKGYGSVRLEDTEILGQRGYKTARMGVNMSPEGRLIFSALFVMVSAPILNAQLLEQCGDVDINCIPAHNMRDSTLFAAFSQVVFR